MNRTRRRPSRFLRPLGLALILTTASNLNAQTILNSGHADIGAAFKGNAWDLYVEHEELGEFEAAEAILQVGLAAQTVVPANPAFGFLGAAGSSVWILPQVDEDDENGHDDSHRLLFLGLSAEEQASGLFANDQLTLSLSSVSGPGQFALYTVDAFGTPVVHMNSADGITAADRVGLMAGSHMHANWAFTMPGDYEVSFRASGILDDGQNTLIQSEVVAYNFSVIPEPGTWALLVLGASVALGLRFRGRGS
jgi:surface-anchored protein